MLFQLKLLILHLHLPMNVFILVINGEKAAFNNTVFGKRKKRTIEAIITSLYENCEKDYQRV